MPLKKSFNKWINGLGEWGNGQESGLNWHGELVNGLGEWVNESGLIGWANGFMGRKVG